MRLAKIIEFYEFTIESHAVTKEFYKFHLCKQATSVETRFFTSPVKYSNFPFPSITSLTDWVHSLKNFPFNFSIVSWKDELSTPPKPTKGMVSISPSCDSEVIDPLLVSTFSTIRLRLDLALIQ